jgi:two-component system chemotaxis response regulator CheB
VLTGTGSDGAMGASAIKSRGGTVIAEDPESAEFRGMPDSVIAAGAVDLILPLDEIAQVICGLVEAEQSFS